MVDTLGVALAVVAALGLAVQSLTIRLGTEHGRVRDFVVISMIVNVVVMGLIAVVGFYPDYGVSVTAIAAFTGAGFAGTLFGRVFFAASVDQIGASRAAPIKASLPFFATVFAVIILGERLTIPHLAGIVLIVCGVALISRESRDSTAVIEDSPWRGVALAVGAAMWFGIEPIFVKLGVAEGMPIYVGLAIKVMTASAGYLGYLSWKDDLPVLGDLWTGSTKWHVAAGSANTAFLLAYYGALAVSPVVLVTPIMQTSPLVVIVVSFVFLQRLERVTWRIASAAGVVVAGGVLVAIYG